MVGRTTPIPVDLIVKVFLLAHRITPVPVKSDRQGPFYHFFVSMVWLVVCDRMRDSRLLLGAFDDSCKSHEIQQGVSADRGI